MNISKSGRTQDAFKAKWLEQMSLPCIKRLKLVSETVSFRNGETLYGLGAEQAWLWGLQQGRVRVHVCMNELEPILGHIHLPGAWFGESELLQGLPGLVRMEADGDISIIKINYAKFRSLTKAHPELWEALAKLTSMNQLLAMSAANDLALRTSSMRIAATLLRLSGLRANYQETATATSIPVTHSEVARLANTSLSKTSEELASFKRDEIVHLEYRNLIILRPEALMAMIAE